MTLSTNKVEVAESTSQPKQNADLPTCEREVVAVTGRGEIASVTGDKGIASSNGERGSASATGPMGMASATNCGGVASVTNWGGVASARGKGGIAAATDARGNALAKGERGIASATGEYCVVEAGGDGLASTTANACHWLVRDGAVLVQRTPKGVFILQQEVLKLPDGEMVMVKHGTVTRKRPDSIWMEEENDTEYI